jgi:tellurite resistance protein TerC
MDTLLFPFAEYWSFYLGFTAAVLVLLALDLGVFHRKAHVVGFREAAFWSVAWVLLAAGFGYGLYRFGLSRFGRDERLLAVAGFDPGVAAWQAALEYYTGYVVEKSLSIDNVFVFVVVFGYFRIPPAYQHRVLFFGIIGALLFRAVFIALGSVLLQYQAVVIVFGAFLVLTGLKMMVAPAKGVEPERNPVLRLFRRFVPVTPGLHGDRFFVRESGRLHAYRCSWRSSSSSSRTSSSPSTRSRPSSPSPANP